MPTQPDYSIIIPAYNEAAELPVTLAAIRSAMDTQSLSGECIVVDNNSTDATTEVAKTAGADLVVFEAINQIARARNTGAQASRGQQLIFVDADTRICAELLAETLRQLATGSCGGGAIIEFENTQQAGVLGCWGIAIWRRISTFTRTAAGSFFFCQRDAFEAVGGFDQKLYASEEVRLSRQLRNWGRAHGLSFDIITQPAARTSARKFHWYSGPKMLGWVFFMMLVPIAVRSRRFCGFWYKRPEGET
ncbi:MAG: glycosyltransferase [Opitutae bacterium]|nr:glycosyltransferase [Opitutae bacterium]